MTSLTLLDSVKHADLRLLPNSGVQFAADLHVLPLRAEEIGKAVSSFPVFMTRHTETGAWSFSAVTSLEVDRNLFVEDSEWMATYVPQIMESYPFYLTQTGQPDQFALAFDESGGALGSADGLAVFDENGKTAEWLETLTRKLQAQLQSGQQSHLFATAVKDAGLVKELGLQVMYADESVQTINGLHTIDEDKLQSLDTDTLTDFSKRGYLSPMYAMLVSIFQLNALIRRHNRIAEKQPEQKTIRQIKIEIARDAGSSGHIV